MLLISSDWFRFECAISYKDTHNIIIALDLNLQHLTGDVGICVSVLNTNEKRDFKSHTKMSKELIIVVACPVRGVGNDPEFLRLAFHKGYAIINAYCAIRGQRSASAKEVCALWELCLVKHHSPTVPLVTNDSLLWTEKHSTLHSQLLKEPEKNIMHFINPLIDEAYVQDHKLIFLGDDW